MAALCLLPLSLTAAEPRMPDRKLMRRVGPGIYKPLYVPTPRDAAIKVSAFWLDKFLVTNGAFAAFVHANPEWRRGSVAKIFADASYLGTWETDAAPGKLVLSAAPVVRVSWFAAKAYCAARNARLPTEAEWELAAAANTQKADASGDAKWRDEIVSWYAAPSPKQLGPVGRSPANFWGIYDLHGLVWEWVLDFNSSLVSSDAREGGDKDRMRFCGAGALNAKDKTDYVKFMRVAMRSSLRADYTTSNLGFRCAANDPTPPP